MIISEDDFNFIGLGQKALFSALFPTKSQLECSLIFKFHQLYNLGCSGILMGLLILSVLCSCILFPLVAFQRNAGIFFQTCSIYYLEVDTYCLNKQKSYFRFFNHEKMKKVELCIDRK